VKIRTTLISIAITLAMSTPTTATGSAQSLAGSDAAAVSRSNLGLTGDAVVSLTRQPVTTDPAPGRDAPTRVKSTTKNTGSAKKNVGATVFYQWRDASKKRVLLRIGTYDYKGNGFGWVKIVAKHHILSPLSVKFVTRAPGGGVRNGNEYIYHAYANRKECVRGSCYYTDSVKVRAVVSWSAPKVHWGVKLDGGPIGVKTTYCLNANKAWACPKWIDLAIGVKGANSGKSAQSSIEWSYAPVKIRGADNDRAQ
jgi:hypothetical protein